ncbi:hypothetical protein OH77DRAFT_1416911 [Trametes cingulata]|nr:hypothetical protein OH77DRAFT_1416911 [Trametes cingulata]
MRTNPPSSPRLDTHPRRRGRPASPKFRPVEPAGAPTLPSSEILQEPVYDPITQRSGVC